MQTFLMWRNYTFSMLNLDPRRLFKQRLEAEGILREITGRSDRWKNHPAVRMWRGYAPALTGYICCISTAARARGLDYAAVSEQRMWQIAAEAGVGGDVPYQVADFMAGALPNFTNRCPVELPPWWADERLYLSHRSALLRKAKEGWRKGHEEGNRRYLVYYDTWLPYYQLVFGDIPDDLPYFWPPKEPEYAIFFQ